MLGASARRRAQPAPDRCPWHQRAGRVPTTRGGTRVARRPPGLGSITPAPGPMQKHSAQARDAPQGRVAGSPKRDRRPASLLLWRRSRQCPRRYRVPGNATVLPEIQRGASQPEPTEGWAQDTQNGPPSVASRNYGFQRDAQLGSPLGSPPPEHHPYLVQRDARPGLGKPRVVAHCRWPGRAAPSRVRVVCIERRRLIDLVSARPTHTDRQWSNAAVALRCVSV
jgi:hypothetical protein